MTHFARWRREYSLRSVFLISICVITFICALFVDLAALLQLGGFISGLPASTLEIGAAITALIGVPLLVMGMSISADLNHTF